MKINTAAWKKTENLWSCKNYLNKKKEEICYGNPMPLPFVSKIADWKIIFKIMCLNFTWNYIIFESIKIIKIAVDLHLNPIHHHDLISPSYTHSALDWLHYYYCCIRVRRKKMEMKTKKRRETFHFNFALALRQLSIAPSLGESTFIFIFIITLIFLFITSHLREFRPFLQTHRNLYSWACLYKFYVLGHHRKKGL